MCYNIGVMPPRDVEFLPEAEAELVALPAREVAALLNAVEKLAALGEELGFPHTSAVQGSDASLRELRPRAGRSAWRAIYRRVGETMVVAAVGPEAQANPRGFDRAVRLAAERLDGPES